MNSDGKKIVKLGSALGIFCTVGALWLFIHRPAPPAREVLPTEVARHDLVQTDGHWYRVGEAKPFTGLMTDFYPGGGRLLLCQISNGLLNGVSETWYTNGQMQVREHFKNGISDGLREKWYENGARQSQATISEGKVVGTFRSWHDNGQLSEQIEMKLGQADGTAWAYYPSGFLKAETAVHDGQVLSRKIWKDGEQRLVR